MRKYPKTKWQDLHWYVIGLSAVVALALGYWGFSSYFASTGNPGSRLSIVYLTLQLFALESGALPGRIPLALEVARFLAPLVAATAALKALLLVFREQAQLLRVKFYRGHVVICGLGRKGHLLARTLRGRGDKVVVVERDEGNDYLEQCRDLGAVVFTGDASDPGVLRKARVGRADHLIALCGDDGVNAEIAVRTRSLLKRRGGRALHVIVHLFDPQLCTLLQEREFEADRTAAFRLDYFNLYERAARSLIKTFSPFSDPGVGGDSAPHFVIVGVGRFGESLIVQSAIRWKDRNGKSGRKLDLTLLDRTAGLKKEMLCLRYPRLSRYCNVRPVDADVESPQFQRGEFLVDIGANSKISHIFICLDNDSLGLSAALTLNRHVRKDSIPVTVRMAHETGLASLLAGKEIDRNGTANIRVFGILDRTFQADLLLGGTHETLARAIHEAYLDQAEDRDSDRWEDTPLVPWDVLPQEFKESCRGQADHIGAKLKAVGCVLFPLSDWDAGLFTFTVEEIERMAMMEHERWLRERLDHGWRHTSGRKDYKRKRHPDLLPWNKLPDTSESKRKSREAVSRLPKFLAAVGYEIRRLAY